MRRIAIALLLLCAAGTAEGQTTSTLRASVAVGSPSHVTLVWTAVAGATEYRIRRTSAYPVWEPEESVGNVTSRIMFAPAGGGYAYQIVPYDAQQQLTPSSIALVTTYPFAEAPITAQATTAKAQHVLELRTMVNAARAAAGLGAATWTNPQLSATSQVTNADVADLRTALNAALANLIGSAPGYTDASLATVPLKKIHIEQIRSRVRNFPEHVTVSSSVGTSPFSPNGDTKKDTTTYAASITSTTALQWTLTIRNASSVTVRTVSGVGSSMSFLWDGKSDAGVVQPDGAHSFELFDNNDGNRVDVRSAVLDNTPPAGGITTPVHGATVSNVRQNGSGNVSIQGTATDTHFVNWNLELRRNGQSLGSLGSGTTALPSPAPLASWATLPSEQNGLYTLRLKITDSADNLTTIDNDVTVGNFTASQNVNQLNAAAAGTVTYTSIVPFPLTQVLTIRNASNNVVRTLVNGTRAAGAYDDVWNGTNDAGQPLPDGAYKYIVELTEGSSTMTWDTGGTAIGGATQFEYPECRRPNGSLGPCHDPAIEFDPYANKPLIIAFCVGSGKVSTACVGNTPTVVVAKVAHVTETNAACDTGCLENRMRPSGAHEIVWYGRNLSSADIANAPQLTVLRLSNLFPSNVTLVHGTAPTLTNLSVTPLMFNPSAATTLQSGHDLSVNLGTFGGRTATLKAEYRNLASMSILRTISMTGVAAGRSTIHWDGRADNGMWVAPGIYEVTLTATDTVGSKSIELRPLVTVRY